MSDFNDTCAELSILDGCREYTGSGEGKWEILYFLEGIGACYTDNSQNLVMCEGELLLFSPEKKYRIVSLPPDSGDCLKICRAVFSAEYMTKLSGLAAQSLLQNGCGLLDRLSAGKSLFVHLKDTSKSIKSFISAAEYEYSHHMDARETVIGNSLLNLLICIVREYEQPREDSISDRNEVIDDLINYIKANFGGNLSLDYLAAYAHLSPGYLSRYFKKRTGRNLSELISEERIENAKHKLRTSSWSINSICEYCGYRTISNFQKAFKKATGMTAGEYRAKSRRTVINYSNM